MDIDHDSLRAQRARKAAGVGTVRCYNCRKEEPEKEKFSKCSVCLNACYCSRKCQVIIIIHCILFTYYILFISVDLVRHNYLCLRV